MSDGDLPINYDENDIVETEIVETEIIPDAKESRSYTYRAAKRKFLSGLSTTMDDELEGSDVEFIPEDTVLSDELFESDEEDSDDGQMMEVERFSGKQFHEGMRKSFKRTTSNTEVKKIKLEQANHSLKLLETLSKKRATPLPRGNASVAVMKEREMRQLRDYHIEIASTVEAMDTGSDFNSELAKESVYLTSPTSFLIQMNQAEAATIRCNRPCNMYEPYQFSNEYNLHKINNFNIDVVRELLLKNPATN